MRAFSRFIGTFMVMLGIGYLAMIVLLPAAPSAADGLQTGRSAAVQLSQQAGALIGRKSESKR